MASPSPTAVPTDAVGQTRGDGLIGGIGLMALGVMLFTGMDAMAKWQSERYDVLQLIFFRAFFGTMVLIPFMLRAGGFAVAVRTRRPGLHFMRGMIGTVSLFTFFLAYRYLELADAIALSFVSPLFMTALSVPILGEQVGWRRWTAIAVGFLGVLVIVRPGGGLFTPLALLPIAGAFTYALVGVTIRVLSRTEASVTIVFYFGLFSSIVAGLGLPFVWQTPASLQDWIGQIGIGLIGGVAQMAMTSAFSRAPVSVVAPFDYTAIIWASVLGYLVWGDVPVAGTFAGAALVIGSGLYILHRETRLRRGT
ncbi:DMT family transporter [Zavarzinia sp.]|uniref:DMT family transporter n=1 Tax=Zavarzinia sp. TaxID=2027920 RepID=UPI0035695533